MAQLHIFPLTFFPVYIFFHRCRTGVCAQGCFPSLIFPHIHSSGPHAVQSDLLPSGSRPEHSVVVWKFCEGDWTCFRCRFQHLHAVCFHIADGFLTSFSTFQRGDGDQTEIFCQIRSQLTVQMSSDFQANVCWVTVSMTSNEHVRNRKFPLHMLHVQSIKKWWWFEASCVKICLSKTYKRIINKSKSRAEG